MNEEIRKLLYNSEDIEQFIYESRFLKNDILEGARFPILKVTKDQTNNFNYKNCEFDQLFFEMTSIDFVVFENCKIEQLFIFESSINNIKFINCEINEIILKDCNINISSLQELNRFKRVVYNRCILNNFKKQISDLCYVNKRQDIYLMNCYHSINLNHDSINNIGKSDFQIIVESINIQNSVIIIGCKKKTIKDWNDWFENSTEEYITPRNTERFERIKNDYISFRNEALKIIENLKKGLN